MAILSRSSFFACFLNVPLDYKTSTVREMVKVFGGSSKKRFSAEEWEILPDFFRGPRYDCPSDEKKDKTHRRADTAF